MDNEFPKGIILTLNRIIYDLDESDNKELAIEMRKFMKIVLGAFQIATPIEDNLLNSEKSHNYSFKQKIRLILYMSHFLAHEILLCIHFLGCPKILFVKPKAQLGSYYGTPSKRKNRIFHDIGQNSFDTYPPYQIMTNYIMKF